ncbi:MAG: GNAT family N-acetyltransferase [Clostridiales bacterium]|nr:GNAT family N-acetyltransferase [Clostridiales bacterium]
MKPNYELIEAKNEDFEFIKNAKIITIFDYAKNISDEEREDILSYVNRFTEKFLKDYKIISKNNIKCGVFLIRDYEDGVLLDEIYLLPEYRNLGIGSNIIKSEIVKHSKVYLWVYKENLKAINLYKKLGFVVFKDEAERYLMLYSN